MATQFTLSKQVKINVAGRPYAGAQAFFYQTGTETLQTVYQDSALTTPHPQPVISDDDGYFPVIWLDPDAAFDYRYVVTSATGVQLEDVSDIPRRMFSSGDISATLDSLSLTDAERILGVTIVNQAYPPLHWWRYGADPTGTTDSRAAIQAAIDVAVAAGGGDPYGPAGTYLINSVASGDSYANGLVIPYSTQNSTTKNVRLCGSGRSTVLKCGSNSMVLIRHSASNSGISRLTLDNNSKTGCCGLGVIAQSMTQTSSRVDQNYNLFEHLWIEGTFTEGIHMKAGPDVSGADSGCWYNTFFAVHVRRAIRGLFLDAANNAGGSPCNRNKFISCRFGEGSMNTGIYILAGDTNEFHGCSCEGVAGGTTPSATPTAIVIKGNTSATASNRFFGFTNESCTRDIENENVLTELYGCLILNGLWTQPPLICIGGYTASSTPQILQGLLYQGNGQIATYENNVHHFYGTNGVSIAGPLRTKPMTTGSGPGGSLTNFDFPLAYVAGSAYLVTRGAYDSAGTSYSHRSSIVFETASGTFVEAASKIIDLQSASVTVSTDTVTRSGSNLRVGVNVAKTATTFTNYASVMRLA